MVVHREVNNRTSLFALGCTPDPTASWPEIVNPMYVFVASAPNASRWNRGGHKRIGDGEPDDSELGAEPALGPYVPIFDPAHVEALRESGRRLSPRHWALVVILTRTGMELEAVARLTWRDVYPDKVFWKPSRSQQSTFFPLEDEELAHAMQVFVTGHRKSSDMLDHWIKQIREEAKIPELLRVTGITLRLTHCLDRLQAGEHSKAVAKEVRLPVPTVLAVVTEMRARGMPVNDDSG